MPTTLTDVFLFHSSRSAEGGKRRDEPGKENLELKNCIALVVI